MLNNYSQINLALFEVFSCSEKLIVLQRFLQHGFGFFGLLVFWLFFCLRPSPRPPLSSVQADVWAGFNFMPLLLSGPCWMGHATCLRRDAAPLFCSSPLWHLSRLFRHDVYLMVKIRLSSECLCKGMINIDWEFQPVAAIR